MTLDEYIRAVEGLMRKPIPSGWMGCVEYDHHKGVEASVTAAFIDRHT